MTKKTIMEISGHYYPLVDGLDFAQGGRDISRCDSKNSKGKDDIQAAIKSLESNEYILQT